MIFSKYFLHNCLKLLTKYTPNLSLREKCPYSEFLFSIFSRIWTKYRKILRISSPYLSVFSPNVGKYRPEKLRMRTLFKQCYGATLPISQIENCNKLRENLKYLRQVL